MKRIGNVLPVCLVVAQIMVTASGLAETEYANGYTWTYRINGDTAEIYNDGSAAISPSPTGSVTIPATLGGKPVTIIGDYALSSCYGLTNVTIASSVKNIGAYAFFYCSALTNVVVPSNVQNIGNSAFSRCHKLEKVIISNGVKRIGLSCFYYCIVLTSVTIPDSVTSIGDRAFEDCRSLTRIDLPTGITHIENGTFRGCENLVRVAIPDSVTYVHKEAFLGCANVRYVIIPQYVCDNTFVFSDAWQSITTVVLQDGVTRISPYTFSNSSNVTHLVIGNAVTNISDTVFSAMRKKLISIEVGKNNLFYSSANGLLLAKDGKTLICGVNGDVDIPDGVTCIRDEAFRGCSGLTRVSIPCSVTTIGIDVFYGCNEAIFDTVTIPGAKIVDGWIVGRTGASIGTIDLTGVRGIGEKVFWCCNSLTGVTIPATMPNIQDEVFAVCSKLESVTIGEGVTSIGNSAFYGCSSLRQIMLPDSVTNVGSSAFSHSGLASVIFGNGIVCISDDMFSGCKNLERVGIPSNVVSIGNSAFKDCTGLLDVSFSNGLASIADDAFLGCSNLMSATVSSYVCFSCLSNIFPSSYQNLTNIVVVDGVTNIDWDISGCHGLQRVNIPTSVSRISATAFRERDMPLYDTSTHPGVIMVDGWVVDYMDMVPEDLALSDIRGIAEKAFMGCASLKSAYIPSNVKNVGAWAFANCSNLGTVVVESYEHTVVDSRAFLGTPYLLGEPFSFMVSEDGTHLYGHAGICPAHVKIPDGVTHIEAGAFKNSESLISVRMPETLTFVDINSFSRLGYTHLGWATCSGGEVVCSRDNPCSGIDLYPVWNANSYTVVFDPAGGTGNMPTQTFTYDMPQNLFSNTFTKAGYVFDGWGKYENYEAVKNLSTEENGVVVLHARWVRTTPWSDLAAAVGLPSAHVAGATGGWCVGQWREVFGVLWPSYVYSYFSLDGPTSIHKLNIDVEGAGMITYWHDVSGIDIYNRDSFDFYVDGGPEPEDWMWVVDSRSISHMDTDYGSQTGIEETTFKLRADGKHTLSFVHKNGKSNVPYYIGNVVWSVEEPVAKYEFNGNSLDSGNFANNGYGYGIDFTEEGFGSSSKSDRRTKACNFDGKSYVRVSDSCSLQTIQDLVSASVWIKIRNWGSDVIPIFSNAYYGNHLVFALDKTKGLVCGSRDHHISMESMPAANEWHHLAYSSDGKTVKVYLDGVCVGQESVKWGSGFGTSVLWIGRDVDGVNYFDGCMEDLRIYSRVLSEEEIVSMVRDRMQLIRLEPMGGILSQTEICASPVRIYDPLPEPIFEGKDFWGWYTSPTGGLRVATPLNVPVGVTTLYARWRHQIRFIDYGDHDVELRWAIEGLPYERLPIASRLGYVFDGWHTEPQGGIKITEDTIVDKWIENVYAHWKVRISLDPQGGNVETNNLTIVEGGAVGELPLPDRIGYSFIGWYCGDSPVVLEESITSSVSYYARWVKNRYAVIFDANGGKGGVTNEQDYASEIITPMVVRDGYMFAGWLPEVPTTVPASNVMYMAQWMVNQYTVTFNANGGTGGTSAAQDYGTAIVAPTVTREGYTFTGWSPTVAARVPAEDVTYTAQWAANQYTVTFDANGGMGDMAPTNFVYDAEYALPSNLFANSGYTFAGWSFASDGEVECNDGEIVSNLTSQAGGAVPLYAQWTASQYVVTFNANGGTGGTSAAQDYGTAIVAPTVTREGYTFTGWSPTVAATVPAEDVTYTAQWAVNQYTVTFDANGGTGGTSAAQDYGTAIVAPTVTREGYTFTGWSPTVAATVPAEDVTYTAQWAVNQYTVTFDANGGSVSPTSRMVTDGAAVGALPTPTRTGYSFAGWWTALNGGVQATETTVVHASVTYYAHWAEILPDPVTPDPVTPSPEMPEPVMPEYDFIEPSDITEAFSASKAVTMQGALYDGSILVGLIELKLGKVNAKKGTSKVSGTVTMLDGKKHTMKAINVAKIDGVSPKVVLLDVKDLGSMTVVVGGMQFAGTLGGRYHVQSAAVGGAWKGGAAKATVEIEAGDLELFPGMLLTALLPDEETATVKGGKWTFAKAAGVKWAKPKKGAEPSEYYNAAAGKDLVVDTSKGKTNLSGLKLTYTPKKGTFKGSFKVYTLEGAGKTTKLKKYTVNVTGFVVDGVGYGTATCKKPVISWPIMVQ